MVSFYYQTKNTLDNISKKDSRDEGEKLCCVSCHSLLMRARSSSKGDDDDVRMRENVARKTY